LGGGGGIVGQGGQAAGVVRRGRAGVVGRSSGGLGGRLGSGLLALVGEVLAVARAADVEAEGAHGEAVEDGHGEGGVAEVAAPVGERDVGADGGAGAAVPGVDEAEQEVGRGGFVVALADLAEADVVDDEQGRPGPALEAGAVGVVGEAGVEVVDEVDAAGVADGDALLACLDDQGLEDVALARPRVAREDEVFVAADEVEAQELEDGGLVDAGLEREVEGLEGLALPEARALDAALDAVPEARLGLVVEDLAEPFGVAGALCEGAGEVGVEVLGDAVQSEDGEGSPESLDVFVVTGGWLPSGHGVSFVLPFFGSWAGRRS